MTRPIIVLSTVPSYTSDARNFYYHIPSPNDYPGDGTMDSRLQKWIDLAKEQKLTPEKLQEALVNRGYVKSTVS
jgi:hypothetical protein